MIQAAEQIPSYPRLLPLTPVPRALALRDRHLFLAGLFGLDVVTVGLAMVLASLLRLQLDAVLPVSALATEQHMLVSLVLIPVLLVFFRFQDLYDLDHILVGTAEYANLVRSATYGAFTALALSYAAGQPLVSRTWLPLFWVLTILCVGAGRFAIRRVVRGLRGHGILRTRVAIIGASSFGVTIAEQLCSARDEGLDVVGFLDEYLPLGQRLVGAIEVVGRPADVLGPGARGVADEFILVPQALPHERQEEISRLMASRRGPVVRMAISSSDMLTHGVQVVARGSVPLVRLEPARLRGMESLLKRALDCIVASIGLVVLSPFAVAALIRGYLAGTRPLLRRATIIGSKGEPCALLLFAYEVVSWPPLRGLPSLLAVLRGDLSLVGPRPMMAASRRTNTELLGLTAVRPGLTGPWRLSGPTASLQHQALLDLTYVRNYSIWEDVRILVESVRRLNHRSRPTLLGRWQSPDLVERPTGETNSVRQGSVLS